MPETKIKAVRLTPPQVELLTDITAKPMYITRWTRWDQTAQALIGKGLAERMRGYAGSRQYGITITEPGRAEAARRGITACAPNSSEGEEAPMIQTLHDNPWLSLRIVRDPERGVNGYVFSHEARCQGRIVAVLPYRETPAGRVYLVRQETTPCWSMEQQLSAVTGGYEGGDIEDDAVREVAEETGYVITRDELLDLGESYASKSSDTVYSLFAVDLTGKTPGAAAGDGSRLEAEGSTAWLLDNALAHVKDPQVALMYVRLEAQLAARAHLAALNSGSAPAPYSEDQR